MKYDEICRYCNRKFKLAHIRRTHENACKVLSDFSLDCAFCARPFKSTDARKQHEPFCMYNLKPTPEKVSLHLTPEDVFQKQPDISTKLSGTHKAQSRFRYLRKRTERFDRKIKRMKAAKKVRRAIKHGFKPINDVRHIKTDQI